MPTTDRSTPKNQNIPKQSFVSRNLVAIVMIPSIIALHYGWNIMQYNRKLVTEDEQIELPVTKFAKYSWKRLLGSSSSEEVSPVTSASDVSHSK